MVSGDAASSVPLPGARTLWLFGDSYLGSVANGQRDHVEFRFGNTIALQQDSASGDAPAVKDLAFDWGPADSNGWLPIDGTILADPAVPGSVEVARTAGLAMLAWPLHGIVIGDDLVLFTLPVSPSECTHDCGPYSFKVHGSVANIVSGVDRPYDAWGVHPGSGWDAAHQPYQRFVPHSRATPALDDATWLVWGTFVTADKENPETLYVYGHRRSAGVGSLVVARVLEVHTAADLLTFDRWTFWNGQDWEPDADAAVAIAADAAAETSIVSAPAANGGGYVMVESGDPFAGEVRVSVSQDPWGYPFVENNTCSNSATLSSKGSTQRRTWPTRPRLTRSCRTTRNLGLARYRNLDRVGEPRSTGVHPTLHSAPMERRLLAQPSRLAETGILKPGANRCRRWLARRSRRVRGFANHDAPARPRVASSRRSDSPRRLRIDDRGQRQRCRAPASRHRGCASGCPSARAMAG